MVAVASVAFLLRVWMRRIRGGPFLQEIQANLEQWSETPGQLGPGHTEEKQKTTFL